MSFHFRLILERETDDARCSRYPKQQRLLALKRQSVQQHCTPPLYLPYLTPSSLSALHPTKFDCILIDPPFCSSFTWDDLVALPISQLASDPSFVFLWVGSGAGDGLERGRDVLAKWGYRRCEDVCWVKTNWETAHKGPGVCFFILFPFLEKEFPDLGLRRRMHRLLRSLLGRNSIVSSASAAQSVVRPILGSFTVTSVRQILFPQNLQNNNHTNNHFLLFCRYRRLNLGRRPPRSNTQATRNVHPHREFLSRDEEARDFWQADLY